MDPERIEQSNASRWRQLLASFCLHCALCRRARQQQGGFAFRLVLLVEEKVCPFCRAYASVYGRKAHEAVSREENLTVVNRAGS